MAARSMIYLKLNPQDIGKFKKCNVDELDLYCDEDYFDNTKFIKEVMKDRVKRVKTNLYMGIYHNNSSYVDVLGKTLVKDFNDYGKILNLILGGDELSIVNHSLANPYMALEDNWALRKPISKDFVPLTPSYRYDYLFQDGKWYFRCGNMQRWRPLTRGIMRKFKDRF